MQIYYTYAMKVTHVSNKNKSVKIKRENEKFYYDDTVVDNIKEIYFIPCAGNIGDAHLIVHADETHFFSKCWLQDGDKKLEDHEKVEKLNASFEGLYTKSMDSARVMEGIVQKSYDISSIYVTENCIIAPKVKLILPSNTVEAVFFERIGSGAKTFDTTFIVDAKPFTISAIQRKENLNYIAKIFASKGAFETGPDPLNWPTLLRIKKNNEIDSWRELHDEFMQNDEDSDEEGSDWLEDGDDSEEDIDYEYTDGESDEESDFGSNASSSDSDDEPCNKKRRCE